MGRLEAAREAVDELMEHASALAFHGTLDDGTKTQVELVLSKARTARAALEGVLAEGKELYEALSPEAKELAVKVATQPSVKPPGGPVPYETMPSPRQRGGPPDADQAPGVFKAALGPDHGQIHPVPNFHHCELCGRRLDLIREDPCRITECPHPRPQDKA